MCSVSVVGGFLDGAQFDLSNGLNCLIGPRGTGKTTVLEFVRYALNAFPRDENGDETRKRVEALVHGNLGGGRIRVTIQTKDGLDYVVSRTAGEEPMVLTPDGQPTNVSLRSAELFGVDIYSQNQIEGIADDPLSQLALLDGFDLATVREIELKIQKTIAELAANANACIEAEKTLGELKDEIATLPGVREKLKGLAVVTGENSQAINKAHDLKALRDRELQAMTSAADWLQEYAKYFGEGLGQFGQQGKAFFGQDILAGPNAAILQEALKGLLALGSDLDSMFQDAAKKVADQVASHTAAAQKLSSAHAMQEIAFQTLIEKHKEIQGQSAERSVWERKHNELMLKEKQHQQRSEELAKLKAQRVELLQQLYELRDRRFATRKAVADRINAEVSPQVRVRIEQYGNPAPYRELLESALKGAGIRHGIVSEKIASGVSPGDLARAIATSDCETLINRAEINSDQAGKVIGTLAGSPLLYQLETVELIDMPRIELMDGGVYKDSLTLSTGQKCTAILPILLMDNENPLLVDQPEDNLDNRFIYTTVVKRIREMKHRRQLVFVTHNPNIPVLGDAEKVFVLNSTGTSATKAKEGTVDECKNEVVTLLEGGEEAFKERKKRYNY
ncbi:MAG: AAA family ATPase [Planctomycetes bacterium]|nr:AAA family ATPase [Planctomycetota bacterium]